MNRRIFVFGSNEGGRHGKGAALTAKEKYGAIYGQGEGLQGDSYAIPTKDRGLRPLPLARIRERVRSFLYFALDNPSMTFMVTPIGCGLAGYNANQIAPMFAQYPAENPCAVTGKCSLPNVKLPEEFKKVLIENSL